MYRLWKLLGTTAYWVLLPLIMLYARATKPRARVLILQGDKVLLVKNWLGAGNWALPGGGIEKSETPAEAVTREAAEELAVIFEIEQLIDLGLHNSPEKGGLITKYYLYAVELSEFPTVIPRKLEITDYGWLPVEQALAQSEGVSSTVKDALEFWSRHQNLV